jgi:NAD(P)-dependent dehydrogenase (short-subunit alcohol dehydrogenase family)
MTTSIVLITGANSGIGKEIARQLADAGFTVHVGCRALERG